MRTVAILVAAVIIWAVASGAVFTALMAARIAFG